MELMEFLTPQLSAKLWRTGVVAMGGRSAALVRSSLTVFQAELTSEN